MALALSLKMWATISTFGANTEKIVLPSRVALRFVVKNRPVEGIVRSQDM